MSRLNDVPAMLAGTADDLEQKARSAAESAQTAAQAWTPVNRPEPAECLTRVSRLVEREQPGPHGRQVRQPLVVNAAEVGQDVGEVQMVPADRVIGGDQVAERRRYRPRPGSVVHHQREDRRQSPHRRRVTPDGPLPDAHHVAQQ